MKAYASSLHAWKLLEAQEGIKVPHSLTFPLAVIAELGRPHGLLMTAEENDPTRAGCYDAVFVSVLDSRCMVTSADRFDAWRLPLHSADRSPADPLVWAGGQGLANPMPYWGIADLIVVGDAEDPLPTLLALWHDHGNGRRFLDEAARVPGVAVPSVHDPTSDVIDQSVAADISITLRQEISVSHDNTRRIEIARGCKYSCAFCSLGWRTPLRENSAAAVIDTIRSSGRRVHLQAGDAESHSGIDTIRTALRAHGGRDSGWTGRLDSLFENPDQTIPGGKRYAFGVEGVTHRLRLAVGKGYLTDERLTADTVRFFDTIEGDSYGRATWHVIAGLPGEQPLDVIELGAVVKEIASRRRGKTRRNLALHWQPFQPLPGTPMQWCSAGGGARRRIEAIRDLGRLGPVRVQFAAGRTDHMAKLCTILSRSDQRGARLLQAMANGAHVSIPDAEGMTGATWQALPVDAALAWDVVRTHVTKDRLAQAHRVVHDRLDRYGAVA